jgi:hypothetical protein
VEVETTALLTGWFSNRVFDSLPTEQRFESGKKNQRGIDWADDVLSYQMQGQVPYTTDLFSSMTLPEHQNMKSQKLKKKVETNL